MTTYSVKITHTDDKSVEVLEVHGSNLSDRDAIREAITPRFGPRCWFAEDRGATAGGTRHFGQIMKTYYRDQNRSSSVTGTIYIDVTNDDQ